MIETETENHLHLDNATMVTMLLCRRTTKTEKDDTRHVSNTEFSTILQRMPDLGLTIDELLTPAGVEILASHHETRAGLATRIRNLLHPDRHDEIRDDFAQLVAQGYWVIARNHEHYPPRFLDKLKAHAPALLYGRGPLERLGSIERGIAIIGSRRTDRPGRDFARTLAWAAMRRGATVITGGTRTAEQAAARVTADAGGETIVVIPALVERHSALRRFSDRADAGEMTIISPYHPRAPFLAMNTLGRNKVMYGLADVGVVVTCEDRSGDAFSGAEESIQREWTPVYVRTGDGVPVGNTRLLKRKATAIAHETMKDDNDLASWLDQFFPVPSSGHEDTGESENTASEDDAKSEDSDDESADEDAGQKNQNSASRHTP